MATHEKKPHEKGRSAESPSISPESSHGNQTSRQGGALPSRHSRYESFPLMRIRDEFEHLLDRFWPALWEGRDRSSFWGLDVDERDDSVVVRAEAPGFEPGDFDLQVRGNQLMICASHEQQAGTKDRSYQWSQQSLCRTVDLPTDVSADKVEANYKNGVLTVTMPKATPSSTRKITVHG